jgi:hypothetical protein
MAKKVEVEIDVKSNLGESIADLKELKKQLKQTAAGSEEFKKLYNQIDDLEDKIKGAKGASADWIDSLESAGGPLGMLGAGLNKVKVAFTSFNGAMKASIIGIVVTAIGGLVAAFSQTDGAMKKLEPLMIAFQRILGGIFEALTPLIDSFIDLATKALPYVTDGVKIFYSTLVALFTLVKEAGAGIGKVLKGVFTLDMDSIKEGYAQLTGTWDKTVQAYDDTATRFEAGTKKLTKIEKENQKDRKEAADKALQEKLKQLEAEDKLDEARLNKLKAEALETAFSEEQKLAVEQSFYEKSYQLKLKDIEDKQKLYKADSVEYKALEAEKLNLQAEGISKAREFADKELQIRKENGDKITEFEVKLAADLQKIDDDKLAKQIQSLEDQTRLDEARLKVLSENSTLYFDAQRKLEDDLYKEKLLKAKGNAKQIEAIELEHKANLKNIDQAEFQAKKDLQLQIVNLYGGFGKALGEIAGKNKGLAIAGLIIEQAAGVAAIIINTQKAAAKAGYFTPLGIATLIAGTASVASAIIATKKGIDQINQTQIPGGSAAGSTASNSTPPVYGGGGASASIPTITSSGGANPATQISQTIQNAQQQPIKAYVVSSDVTTQQALDRKTNKAATFGLG